MTVSHLLVVIVRAVQIKSRRNGLRLNYSLSAQSVSQAEARFFTRTKFSLRCLYLLHTAKGAKVSPYAKKLQNEEMLTFIG